MIPSSRPYRLQQARIGAILYHAALDHGLLTLTDEERAYLQFVLNLHAQLDIEDADLFDRRYATAG